VSKHFKLSLVALACAAVLGLAAPAEATDGNGILPRHASLGAVSAPAYLPARPLFGMETEPAMGEVSSKWHAVEAEIEQDEAVLGQCRAEQACSAAARELLDIVAEGADRTGRARVGLINRAVNLALILTGDERQWGVEDHWSPPLETLQTHRGDCEDYAIVKYLALLEAGLSRDDLKIVIVRNLLPNEDHAVLAARVDGEWLILNDNSPALVRDLDMVRVQPKFLLDQHGAHRLVPSNRAAAGAENARPHRSLLTIAAAASG
jgi:predicted transglutaminase-like cysteine proteinase